MTLAEDGSIEDCDFCAIARGHDRAVEVVCQGDDWIAFFPQRPATKGHTLVIPRRHVADVWELDERVGSHLMSAVVLVGRAVEKAVRPEGMNLISSKGRAAEQTVFHLHLHVLPRWNRDGFDRIWPTENSYEGTDLEAVADRIRSACSDPPLTDVERSS